MIKSFWTYLSFKNIYKKKFPNFYEFLYFLWWQKVYKKIWLLLFRPKGTLVQVGLNKGDSFANLHYKYELAIGYEANPDLSNYLKNKFKRCKNVKIFNLAASDKNSEEKFYISDNFNMVSSSLSKFDKSDTQKIGCKKVIKVKTVHLGEHWIV